MASKRLQFSEELRRAIDKSEMSRYAICKKTGIDQAVLSRFMHGKTGLSIRAVDLLYACLGLKTTTPKQRKKGK